MSIEFVEALSSLCAIVAEENTMLATRPPPLVPPELVAAKLRLIGMVEAETVRLGTDWTTALDEEARAAVQQLLDELREALALNADLLRRRLALCEDLLGAIAAEARRLTGGRTMTYGALGRAAGIDRAVPIAVNASL